MEAPMSLHITTMINVPPGRSSRLLEPGQLDPSMQVIPRRGKIIAIKWGDNVVFMDCMVYMCLCGTW